MRTEGAFSSNSGALNGGTTAGGAGRRGCWTFRICIKIKNINIFNC